MIFVIALVAVPATALTAIGFELARGADASAGEILLPAGLGAAVASLSVTLARRRRVRVRETVASALVVAAAVLGTHSDYLPRSVDAFLNGAAVGFFLAVSVIVAKLWQTDEAFRRRIKAVRRT